MKSLVFGIDGGGTKSRMAVHSLSGGTVWAGEAGSTNFYSVSSEEVALSYRMLFQDFLKQTSYSVDDLSCGCIGSAGLSRKVEKQKVEEILSSIIGNTPVVYHTDGRLLLEGGLGGEDGICLICGTGSIAYAKKGESVFRQGGLGWRLGDEGSAWWMVDQAVRRLVKDDDMGRCRSGELKSLVLDYFSVSSCFDLVTVFNSPQLSKSFVAGLSKDISSLASKSDPVAGEIVDATVNELVCLVEAIFSKARFNSPCVRLVLSGGVFENDGFVLNLFCNELLRVMPNIQIVQRKGSALDGAVSLATEYAMKNRLS